MRKTSLVMAVLVVLGLLVTSAFTFPLSVRNGLVTGYTAGKSLTINGFDHNPSSYSLATNTKIFPSSLADGVTPGSRVTVFAQCYHTTKTSGCIALGIVVRQAATSSTQTAAPGATPQPTPQATPTP